MDYKILITIDVEDWFQVENLRQSIPFSYWPYCDLRVEKNVHQLLDLLDSVKLATEFPGPTLANHRFPKATFFVLGWIAKRTPKIVQEIHNRGHEVASHGYNHFMCHQQSREELKSDLTHSKKLLEDLISAPVYGYRAPSFSINSKILYSIQESGYLYDSSYNSFAGNSRYGHVNILQNGAKHSIIKISDSFYEIPIGNISVRSIVFPWGGGGYFRLIPLSLYRFGVKSILKKQKNFVFYLHPWEIDLKQPRVRNIPIFLKFRHYVNLSKTASKLLSFIKSFHHCEFTRCIDHVTESQI